jgi:hypothetical protein
MLAGCTAQHDPPPLRPTASPAASGLPSGFPASVPLLPGRVVAGAVDGADLHAWVASADPEVGYRDAKALLVDAGFVLTKDRVATGGGDGQACSTASLCVNFTGSDDAVYGETVQYDVFHGTGIVG